MPKKRKLCSSDLIYQEQIESCSGIIHRPAAGLNQICHKLISRPSGMPTLSHEPSASVTKRQCGPVDLTNTYQINVPPVYDHLSEM